MESAAPPGRGLAPSRQAVVRAVVDRLVRARDRIAQVDAVDMAAHGAEGLAAHKIICEIALLLHVGRDALRADHGLVAAIRAFLDWALARTVTPALRADLDRYPQTAGSVALLLVAARDFDVPCPIEDEVVAAIRSPLFLSAERLPFRAQEALWLRGQVLGGAPSAGLGAFGGSLLDRPTHPALLTRDDLYAITHSAMYVTDFGRRPPGSFHVPAGGGTMVRHALALCVCNADWDLVGEFLMTARYLGLAPSPVEAQARAALEAVHARFGLVPSLGFDGAACRRASGDEAELYRLAHSYHSTLVFALLQAAPEPPTEPAGTAETAVDRGAALRALAGLFGPAELGRGCLDRRWFDREVEIGWDLLLDGQAMRGHRAFGRARAVAFIDAIPGAGALPHVQDTHDMLRREGRYA